MSAAVFILSALTTLTCAVLLARAWRKNRNRLLGAASLCFLGLALTDALVFADVVVFPGFNLLGWRTLPALIGVGIVVVALTQEET